MLKIIKNTFFPLVIIIIFQIIQCTHAPLTNSNVSLFSKAIKNDPYQNEIQGFCTVSLGKNQIRARLMAVEENDSAKALLMDELGVPLAATVYTQNNLELLRTFPPFSKKEVKLFGWITTAHLRSRQLLPIVNGTITDSVAPKTFFLYQYSQNNLDSIELYIQKNRYVILPDKDIFHALSESNDTVCSCVLQ